MTGFFHVTVVSLPSYNELVAEIYVNDKFVGLLSQENGPENTLLELAVSNVSEQPKISLRTFEKALEEAKQRLFDLRKA